MGMYEFKYPFTPPAEDLALEGVTSNGIHFAVYDTFCKEAQGPEEKARTDRRITEIYTRAAQRKFLAEMSKP